MAGLRGLQGLQDLGIGVRAQGFEGLHALQG